MPDSDHDHADDHSHAGHSHGDESGHDEENGALPHIHRVISHTHAETPHSHACSHDHSHDESHSHDDSPASKKLARGHDHSHHGHHHGHSHSHPTTNLSAQHLQVLKWVFILTVIYLVVEIVGGVISGSLALLADGVHMFGDAGGIGISLFAQWFAHRPADRQHTFGYQRLEILAALFNAVSLVVIGVWILFACFHRASDPAAINGGMMFWIAVGGLIVNLISAKLLHGDHDHNLNIKGAYLHVLGDLLGSVGAIVASILVSQLHWGLADPIISGVIAVLIIFSATGLFKDAINVLLEGCPAHINIDEIRAHILSFEGIRAVHNLHVWNINLQRVVLTAHLEVEPYAYTGDTLSTVQTALKEEFDLSHVTLQMEHWQEPA